MTNAVMEFDPTLVAATVADGLRNTPQREALSVASLQPVLRLVEAGLERQLHVSDMAQAVGLSVFHFSREFRRVMGASPYAYVRRRRIARAALLLAGSKLPIVEIARGVGFKTHAHFSGAFLRTAGMTPRSYRIRYGGSNAPPRPGAAAAKALGAVA